MSEVSRTDCNQEEFCLNTEMTSQDLGVWMKAFQNQFTHLVDEIVTNPEYNDMSEINQSLEKCLYHNVPGDGNFRGIFCILTTQHFSKTLQDFSLIKKDAITLGWCIEMIQSAICVTEDFVKGTETRGGKKCWHLEANMDAFAFNDTLLVVGGVYYLLKKHFGHMEFYPLLLTAFRDAQFSRTLGSTLIQRTKLNKDNAQVLNLKRYYSIVGFNSEISFFLPVVSAINLAGVKDFVDIIPIIKLFCEKLGLMHQLRTDQCRQLSSKWTDCNFYECWSLYAIFQYGTSTQKLEVVESLDDLGNVKRQDKISDLVSELGLVTILENEIAELKVEILDYVDKLEFREKALCEMLYEFVSSDKFPHCV